MTWHDDNWRDSYDAWKLASPDDDREDECLHEAFEIDFQGRAHCSDCLASWWPTADEERWFREANEHYDAYCRKQERVERRRELWLRSTRWIRWPVGRLLDRILPAKWWRYMDRNWRAVDDEIPF